MKPGDLICFKREGLDFFQEGNQTMLVVGFSNFKNINNRKRTFSLAIYDFFFISDKAYLSETGQVFFKIISNSSAFWVEDFEMHFCFDVIGEG